MRHKAGPKSWEAGLTAPHAAMPAATPAAAGKTMGQVFTGTGEREREKMHSLAGVRIRGYADHPAMLKGEKRTAPLDAIHQETRDPRKKCQKVIDRQEP